MAEYLSPGVYVEEFDSGSSAMEGVGTSTAGFIGMAEKGPIEGMPVFITSMADYNRRFGSYLPEQKYGSMRYLPYAVEQFFNNGGSGCYVMRVCRVQEETSEEASGETSEEDKNASAAASRALGAVETFDGELFTEKSLVKVQSADPGEWGNGLTAEVSFGFTSRILAKDFDGENVCCTAPGISGYQAGDMVFVQNPEKKEKSFYNRIDSIDKEKLKFKWKFDGEDMSQGNIFLYLVTVAMDASDKTAAEHYGDMSLNPLRSNFVAAEVKKSRLMMMETFFNDVGQGELERIAGTDKDPHFRLVFSGGSDGEIRFDAGLYMGKDGAPDKRTGLMAFKTLSDVSIMAIPGITDKTVQSALVSHCEGLGSRFAVLDMPFDCKEPAELLEFKENIDSSYGAMYHPWLLCYDPLAGRSAYLPPSGSVAGIYGRTDNSRGVHKAPANETVRNCTGLSVTYNEAEQGRLNPKGVNLIRKLSGYGIRVWGARTCSSDGSWKYVNVRRFFIFLEESIRANTNWVVFEPNDELLWSRVEGTIRAFLTTQWRNGALAGSSEEEAFFINIGKSTMTEDDILNGRLICVIGVAPVRPAEFVIFRITQKMGDAK